MISVRALWPFGSSLRLVPVLLPPLLRRHAGGLRVSVWGVHTRPVSGGGGASALHGKWEIHLHLLSCLCGFNTTWHVGDAVDFMFLIVI